MKCMATCKASISPLIPCWLHGFAVANSVAVTVRVTVAVCCPITEVAVPLEDLQDSDDEGSPRYVNKFEQLADKVTDHLKIPHEGEVNRAR
jgi:hypothetical protein